MIRLKDILMETLLREYVDTDITKLMAYLNSSPEDKLRELEKAVGYFVMVDHYAYSNPNEEEIGRLKSYGSLAVMAQRGPEDYLKFLKWYSFVIMGEELLRLYQRANKQFRTVPSWYWLQEPEIIKNQWLIHGTSQSDAMFMTKQGFIKGMGDMTKLGLTTWFDGRSAEKRAGGYNFAYTIDDFSKYGVKGSGIDDVTYGDGTILMFRASGIRSYHITDHEYQTIFNGKTARDIFPIFEQFGSLVILSKERKILAKFNDHGSAVNWVVNNYDQYRKAIGWEKPIR